VAHGRLFKIQWGVAKFWFSKGETGSIRTRGWRLAEGSTRQRGLVSVLLGCRRDEHVEASVTLSPMSGQHKRTVDLADVAGAALSPGLRRPDQLGSELDDQSRAGQVSVDASAIRRNEVEGAHVADRAVEGRWATRCDGREKQRVSADLEHPHRSTTHRRWQSCPRQRRPPPS
jgi:hypothetical protein